MDKCGDKTALRGEGKVTGFLQQAKTKSEEILAGSVLEPNPKYRTAIGFLGVALPPVLLVWAVKDGVQSSISAYYYTAP